MQLTTEERQNQIQFVSDTVQQIGAKKETQNSFKLKQERVRNSYHDYTLPSDNNSPNGTDYPRKTEPSLKLVPILLGNYILSSDNNSPN